MPKRCNCNFRVGDMIHWDKHRSDVQYDDRHPYAYNVDAVFVIQTTTKWYDGSRYLLGDRKWWLACCDAKLYDLIDELGK